MSGKDQIILSPEQAAIVEAPVSEDVLVVAGAGSGKTFTMTQRIIALIEHGIRPEKILGLTFTHKAAAELLSRVSAAVNAHGESSFMKPDVLTYDAFFQTIVRQYGLLVAFDQETQPISEAGAKQLITTVVDRNMKLLFNDEAPFGKFSDVVNAVYQLNSNISSSMIGKDCTSVEEAVTKISTWDQAFIETVVDLIGEEPVPEEEPAIPKKPSQGRASEATYEKKLAEWSKKVAEQTHQLALYRAGELLRETRKREVLLQLVKEYAAEKRRAHLAEFSDFTIAAFQLVNRFPSIGERYRARYSHVLLDEYQDTSSTQASLLAALFHASTGDSSAVSAVGDPFQSIYAWRGASPGAFRMFQEDFGTDQEPLPLSVTRRNPDLVLEAANNLTQVLRRTEKRPSNSWLREVDVPALSSPEGSTEGTLGVMEYETRGQEIDGVVRFATEAKRRAEEREGVRAGQLTTTPVAILFRGKSRMGDYQEALENAGLTTMAVGYSAVMERPEIVDILSLLHVVAERNDSQSLLRLLATPRFGLSAADLDAFATLADRENTRYRYRALQEAGIIKAEGGSTEADFELQKQAVREHRDKVPNAVFLTDVLLSDNLDQLLQDSKVSEQGRLAIRIASRMVKRLEGRMYQPLDQLVHSAAEELNLDIDLLVASRMKQRAKGEETQAEVALSPAILRSSVDTLVDTVHTYTNEIAIAQTPTLRGYLAWQDSLSKVDEDTSALADTNVDVVLMTIHQAKGLQWDAVVVVGLADKTFPSSQGDRLKVVRASGEPDPDKAWEAPIYTDTAHTWLTDASAVPAPVRVDEHILPRFPHDAKDDQIAALHALDDVDMLEDEVFGGTREVQGEVNLMSSAEMDAWPLSQSEEYGRRLHADERRLMYVALTRAKHEAFLCYAKRSAMVRDPRGLTGNSMKPSNFLEEVRDSMAYHSNKAEMPTNLQETLDVEEIEARESAHKPLSLAQLGISVPQGYFLGEHAQEYENAVVGAAWNEPLESAEDEAKAHWPLALPENVGTQLGAYVPDIEQRMRQLQEKEETGQASEQADTLLARARRLMRMRELSQALEQREEEENLDLAAKARRVTERKRATVTSIQSRAALREEEGGNSLQMLRMILRPIPKVSSRAAREGTRLHAWAERFLNPEGTTRQAMVQEVHNAENSQLKTWQEHLIASPWAKRAPYAAENDIVVALELPGEEPTVVQGKLDAVFYGGLDPQDRNKEFTVVDWKTGKKPRTQEEIHDKLMQLDMYRLLLAKKEDLPLDSIDAVLYYLSEPQEGDRELRARDKTEQEILAELSSGIPDISGEE